MSSSSIVSTRPYGSDALSRGIAIDVDRTDVT
ncbi:hypothetical protein FHT97_001521 [Rhizobium sp. BK399]|nr:hypothetical protein [Rhizobium sp. BK399]